MLDDNLGTCHDRSQKTFTSFEYPCPQTEYLNSMLTETDRLTHKSQFLTT